MRNYLLTLILLFNTAPSFSHPDRIVAGNQPGEIYIVAPMSGVCGEAGFYYSSDYGETLELRDSAYVGSYGEFGRILPDAAENTVHRFYDLTAYQHLLTRNGGYTWEEINDTIPTHPAAGIIPGEIYRSINVSTYYDYIARSDNYGQNYTFCPCIGFPYSSIVGSTALGVDSGDVYIKGSTSNLYYSNDYGEHFDLVCQLYGTYGLPLQGLTIYNGTAPGEVFVHRYDWHKLWLVHDYGDTLIEFSNFDYSPLYPGCAAPTRNPGEVYYMVSMLGFSGGGTVHIYHTDNYGEDWIRYEHEWSPEKVKDIKDYIPCDISMSVYPNPFNASTAINYKLQAASRVNLTIYDITGREVAKLVDDYQTAGNHEVVFDAKDLVSGVYFVRLKVEGSMSMVRKMVLMK